MAGLIEAIAIKRKMFFEFEDAPYHCIDVEISKPTARGGQTLVRLKMRNLITRAVFDKTFRAGDKFREPDLVIVSTTLPDADACALCTRLTAPGEPRRLVVALAPRDSRSERRRFLGAGCAGFLCKPIDVRLFAQDLARALG